jgi:hypothetical protein
MALPFKPGDSVKQNVRIIEGTVSGLEIVDSEVQYKVQYTGEDGQPHERLFKEEDITKVE